MGTSVYGINRGIGKPVVFKGLKAQWIWWLGGGITVLLLIFAVMYIVDVALIGCVVVVGVLGAGLFWLVYAFSKKYGEHGLMKEVARRSVPGALKGCSRKSVERTVCNENSERGVAGVVGRK